MEEQLELEATIQQEMAGSDDFVEGVDARSCRSARPPSAAAERRAASRRPCRLRRDYHPRRLAPELARSPPPGAAASSLAGSPLAACRSPPRGPASADFWTPESGGSPNADDIDTLYKIVLAVAVVVFFGVEGALLYSLFKFRARKGAVAAQIRGNTRLEIGWTVGAAVILVVLAVRHVHQARRHPQPGRTRAPDGLQTAGRPILAAAGRRAPAAERQVAEHRVNGQQYIWRYTYPDGRLEHPRQRRSPTTEMVVPTDTTVTLDIRAQDVAHSWWIPKLGGKFDAVPGYTNHTWFKIPAKLAGQAQGTSSAASAPSCAGATTRT